LSHFSFYFYNALMIKPVLLATDWALLALFVSLIAYVLHVRRTPPLAAQWARVFTAKVGMACAVVLAAFMLLTLLDSLHYRTPLASNQNAVQAYSPQTTSVLEALLAHMKAGQEKTYSHPFSTTQLVKETALIDGKSLRDNPPLKFAGAHLRPAGLRGDLTAAVVWQDILLRGAAGALLGAGVAAVLVGLWLAALLAGAGLAFKDSGGFLQRSKLPWVTAFTTLAALCVLGGVVWQISQGWHVLGTDRAGKDMVYLALKSVRTALAIAFITVLASLPFALVLGIVAGTLRGWADTLIQYIYTVLSSIPGILLIAACVLMIQSYIDNNAASFATALERADVKLFLLCLVLGLTSWAGLARLLRAEAMKLREMDFVLAARSFGVPMWRIMMRHIAPNTMHLLILTVSMEFSALVLYEAVLSYIGIGVDPAIHSFGGMINGARTELARNPIIWWPLLSAFAFMLALVLSANLFADCVRDAFDPKTKVGAKP
jgi:peptide/nickel transport system permease protein